MDKDNLFKVSDSLVNFLWIIQNDLLKEHDITKNFQLSLNGQKKYLSDVSIPHSHVKVIFYLIESNSSPISQIADNLGVSKSNMTPIIDNLINHGLVKRYPDSNDRRILRVELTDKAWEMFDYFRTALNDLFTTKLSSLSDDEIILLDDSITNLVTIFKKLK